MAVTVLIKNCNNNVWEKTNRCFMCQMVRNERFFQIFAVIELIRCESRGQPPCFKAILTAVQTFTQNFLEPLLKAKYLNLAAEPTKQMEWLNKLFYDR